MSTGTGPRIKQSCIFVLPSEYIYLRTENVKFKESCSPNGSFGVYRISLSHCARQYIYTNVNTHTHVIHAPTHGVMYAIYVFIFRVRDTRSRFVAHNFI